MNELLKNERVTIIIPIYNVEKYLYRCVRSVLNQKYSNIEIILVDDGSFDNSPQMCDDLAKTDFRIKVIHKKNGGLSDARNVGIDNASGEYIVFIDSDDYVDNNHISTLFNLRKKYDADIAISPFFYEKINGKKLNRKNFDKIIILDKNNWQNELLLGKHFVGRSACSRIYKKEIFNYHRFIKNAYCEDLMFTLETYNDYNKIVIADIPTYHYVQHNGSIMHSRIDFNKFNLLLNFIEKYIVKFDKKYCYIHTLIEAVANSSYNVCAMNDVKIFCEIKNRLLKYKYIYMHSKNTRKRDKIKFYLLTTNFFTFKLFYYMRNIYQKIKMY